MLLLSSPTTTVLLTPPPFGVLSLVVADFVPFAAVAGDEVALAELGLGMVRILN